MTTTKALGNFAQTLLALVKGDKDEQLALHNERRAASAIKKQIHSLEDRKTSLEEELEDANDKLKEAKYPTTYKLGENSNYCSNIKTAQEKVDTIQEEIKNIEESIKYFEGLKKELSL
jgi:chromosome segregation ATPase